MQGPTLEISKHIHAEKYRAEGESFEEAVYRICNAMTDGNEDYHNLVDIIGNMRFLPAGRVQTAMGSLRKTTAYNCLSGDTKIMTKEFGMIEIANVAGTKVHVIDGNGDWTESFVYNHGPQETFEHHFKGGFEKKTIRSTKEHGWICPDNMTSFKTKSLDGFFKKKTVGQITPKFNIDAEDHLMGMTHGWFYGDGTKTKEGSFRLTICSDVEETINIIGGLRKTEPTKSCPYPSLHISKKDAWWDMKKLPIGEFSQSYILGFLKGWFAADGCVSNQPEATICCNEKEADWISSFAPSVGWFTNGFSLLAEETNFGKRTKKSGNLRFKTHSLIKDDFVLSKHRDRWKRNTRQTEWRAFNGLHNPRIENVYCPLVPTTHSFMIEGGIHSANCYVSMTIEDSMESIMKALTEAAETMRLGGGIGYDFSNLRPKGDRIKSLDSVSSGPVSFMNIFNALCGTISSAGHRRGAQMGCLRIDHPDIEEFITSKQNQTELTNFNISVLVTDKFMKAVETNDSFDLMFEGEIYKTVHARSLWDKLMRATWDYAEPGVLFIDRINRKNNLWYCEEIAATNPCGEQPLAPHAACLLGSLNLVKYLEPVNMTGNKFEFNWYQFISDIRNVVPAMDNVIDRTIYPLDEQRQAAQDKRRMGLGITGLANASEILGMAYGSEEMLQFTADVLEKLRDIAYLTSIELAKEKGPFPLFDADKYLESEFALTLPSNIRNGIKEYGIRNSHLLSIAPTGTISLTADNVSSGIEPVFTKEYTRTIRGFDGEYTVDVKDYAWKNFNVEPRSASEITPEEHVKVLNVASYYVDSACSKTCNVGEDVSWDRFKDIYIKAYEGGSSGCTTFRASGKRFGILNEKKPEVEKDGAQCTIDFETGIKTCDE